MEAVPKPRSDDGAGLSIRKAAERTGITTHTLRYYERIGLVQPVARARSGHRRYGQGDLQWLELVKKLHATDMPIRRMLEYARLARRGDSTIAERRALLDAHRMEIEAKLARLGATLEAIEAKLELYDRALANQRIAAVGSARRPRRRQGQPA
jgi:DNA-binding transcriptional MerR regulator